MATADTGIVGLSDTAVKKLRGNVKTAETEGIFVYFV